MNRREFLATLGIGAPAAVVAAKAGLFERVRSYFFAPKGGWQLTSKQLEFVTGRMPNALYGGARGGGKLVSLAGLEWCVDPHIPQNEIWLVRAGKYQSLHLHEGSQAGETLTRVVRPGQIFRIINLGPTS